MIPYTNCLCSRRTGNLHLRDFTHPKNNNKQKPPNIRAQPLRLLPDHSQQTNDKFNNIPKPLVKASSLGVWRRGTKENKKKVEFRNVEEWKKLVEKKKNLGDRLLAQYTPDYESSRGQSGDIKLLTTTQRSGTAADKVSAFSVIVGENPIANLRSLDALIETASNISLSPNPVITKAYVVFPDLEVDPHQILMVTVAVALREIGYEIEIELNGMRL